MTTAPLDHEVLVIGAGFSGIGAAIKLDEAGFSDYLVLEKDDGVGGAWHANTYPGVAVDIPSFSYSFSFERNPDWSRLYAPGAELKAYAEHCVDKYGLRERIRLDTKVVALEFDERDACWTVRIDGGDQLRARYVIAAVGVLTQPKKPAIPGVDDFRGPVMHTARWDHTQDLAGRRVAVIGTGASALQLVPAIAAEVEHLTVFQRTPIWVLPKLDAPLGPAVRRVLRRLPAAGRPARLVAHGFVEATFVLAAHYYATLPWLVRSGERTALKHLRKQVHDPVTRDKLTPRYGLGCKRPSFSNTYLAAFNRENVALETTPIERITADAVVTSDGTAHPVDVLVLATGFKVFEAGNMPPYEVTGVGGLDLEKWFDANRFQAYHGVSVPAFPNLFSILGPYGFNGTSYFQLIENQMRHIVRCLTTARARGADRIEIRPEANDRYFRAMLERRPRQVFFNNNCAGANSYYFDKHGDVPFRPATSLEMFWQS
ncbi:MAG TPA: NAD(P)/FAD-dependent oxidoreductase, partial [Jatrophihabitans sp.]|nr:NAD(P)/FAD-dependent oxidoreductase [Jatrophihabitans sp.]